MRYQGAKTHMNESVQNKTQTTTWSSTRSAEDLRQQQRNDADIGPILQAKLTGNKPSSQDMVTRTPASRHYWILWDSLAVYDGILCKKFVKRDVPPVSGTLKYEDGDTPSDA